MLFNEIKFSSDKNRILIGAILSIGVLARLSQFLFNRSLWLDEAMLALNIINRSFFGLFQTLDNSQTAPIGFLIFSKIAVSLFNPYDYILRLIPLFTGILALFLFYFLIKPISSKKTIPFALCFFAISDPLIYYSSEVKHYSVDVLITIVLLLFFIRIGTKKIDALRLATMAVVGASAIWFSFPAVFVLAGLALSMLSFRIVEKEWGKIGKLSIAYFFWFLSFVIYFLVSLSKSSHDPQLLRYFNVGFMPFPPTSINDLLWLPLSFYRFFDFVFHFPTHGFLILKIIFAGLVMIAFLMGCYSVFSSKKEYFFYLFSPIIIALIASATQKYPFEGRLLLFLIPVVILFTCEGLMIIVNSLITYNRGLAFLIIAILIVQPAYSMSYHIIFPRTKEEIKPVLKYLDTHKQNGDMLYLYNLSFYAFKFYSRYYNFDDIDVVRGVTEREDPQKYLAELSELEGKNRVWFLFSHVMNTKAAGNEEVFYLEYLDGLGMRIEDLQESGASLYLYDLRNGSMPDT